MEIKNCPGLLLEGFSEYSPLFLRRMFDGRKVSHILPYNSPEIDEEDQKKFMQNRKRISGSSEKLNSDSEQVGLSSCPSPFASILFHSETLQRSDYLFQSRGNGKVGDCG